MKTIINITLAALLIVGLAISTSAQDANQWKIDKSHASVGFSINHFFSEVPGKFKDFDGNIVFDANNLKNSNAEFIIQVASIDTDEEKRDNHLQSGDFFAADQYPTITFKSTNFEKVNDSQYKVHGKLTMRETTKDVVLPMKISGTMDNPWVEGKVIMGIVIETTIDRTDYGVGTGSWAATAVVSDEVEIKISMELDGMKN